MGIQEDNRRLEELDRRYIWHPFTQMKEWVEETPIIIAEGRDCFLKDICGRWYLDGVSSLWVNIFGHRKKEIDDAIKEQLDKISHSTLLGLSNVPAIKLAERLVQIVKESLLPLSGIGDEKRVESNESFQSGNLPIPPLEKGGEGGFEYSCSGLSKVFYSDNGSTAVEVGLKMAFQYWKQKGVDGRHAFVSLKNGYHGDTIGAISVGGVDIFHKAFGPLLFNSYKAPSPYCYRCELGETYPECSLSCLDELDKILYAHSGEIAGLIVEPLIQAAGGMITSPPGYLRGVRELCSKYDILMIADEVATGFGRTGKMFACAHEQVLPDIMCLSKGITGGYMPLAVTVATDDIYNAFLGDFRELKTFFHGHSYTGNPLACAAALACLDLFDKEKVLEGLQGKIGMLDEWLRELLTLPHVGDVRHAGFMAGVELVREKATKEPYAWEEKVGWKVAYYARDNGVFIRPLGNVIVIMPPLSISGQNLKRLLEVIRSAIMSVCSQ
jgi:adenosylmethionine---8-amino-7-oxononanoate aminotransferase